MLGQRSRRRNVGKLGACLRELRARLARLDTADDPGLEAACDQVIGLGKSINGLREQFCLPIIAAQRHIIGCKVGLKAQPDRGKIIARSLHFRLASGNAVAHATP